jgi:DNA processing protein
MTPMLTSPGIGLNDERFARAALTYLAEPGDPALGALLCVCEPAEVLAAIKAGTLPGPVMDRVMEVPAARGAVAKALQRWRLRLPLLPEAGRIAGLAGSGIRLVCPADPEWPDSLDALGPARPYALWLRGHGDLGFGCMCSASIVGSRAASGYGAHVAGEIAGDLAERDWAIVSGGAYGIDAAAHRGALHAGGCTIAVLACGVDHPYPAGHADLFAAIAGDGLLVSEWPPGSRPTRLRFLVRNRVIATLTRGTVVVEAGERSGALNTARHAASLGKYLMAVPGPVTSVQSAGCHRIIRDWNGSLVTCADDVIGLLGSIGDGPSREAAARGPADRAAERGRDDLDRDSIRVLDAFPVRGGAGLSTLAVQAGVEPDTVLACLGRLAVRGLIERCASGWRLSRKAVR